MARTSRARFVALVSLLEEHHPEVGDPRPLIAGGRVVVDGRAVTNPGSLVRRDAAVRIQAPPAPLRGTTKLNRALAAFALTDGIRERVAVDVGAAAGGFTTALLDAGAARVYAVDVGFGQLTGRLRIDPRVVVLERTNIASLDQRLVPDTVDVVTLDLSYLPLARAVTHLERLSLAPHALLLALVKPTFELRRSRLATDGPSVGAAVVAAADAVAHHRWRVEATTLPAVTGGNGAVEVFVLARR